MPAETRAPSQMLHIMRFSFSGFEGRIWTIAHHDWMSRQFARLQVSYLGRCRFPNAQEGPRSLVDNEFKRWQAVCNDSYKQKELCKELGSNMFKLPWESSEWQFHFDGEESRLHWWPQNVMEKRSGAGFESRQERTIHFFLAWLVWVVVSLLAILIVWSEAEELASVSGLIVVHIVMHLAFVLNSFASLLMRRSESRAFRDHAPGPVSKFFGFFGACMACQSSGSIPASPFWFLKGSFPLQQWNFCCCWLQQLGLLRNVLDLNKGSSIC